MINPRELEQRSEAWRLARVGHVTASRVSDVVKTINNGKGYSTKRAHYFDELIAERITGRPQDWKEVRSLTERSEMEPDARLCYSFYTEHEVDLVGFIKHPTIEFAGASPDGLIKPCGMIEIKCLDAKYHLKLIAGDESVMTEYLPQMDFEMACAEMEWNDFVSFNPFVPEELKLYVKRVSRNEKRINEVEAAVKKFLAEVDARVEQIMALRNGTSVLTSALEQSLQAVAKA